MMPIKETYNPAVPRKSLHSYKLLSFDIYGTLVNDEGGILPYLTALQKLLPKSHPLSKDEAKLFQTWDHCEDVLKKSQPKLPYGDLLAQSLKALAREDLGLTTDVLSDADLNEQAAAFGASVRDWPAFPDTVAALNDFRALGFKLVPLSNITRALFAQTNEFALEGFSFDAVYTAEDIGSYKPDLNHFHYLFDHVHEQFGVRQDEIFQVAHGLSADHEPAKKLGLQSTWIERPDTIAETTGEAEQGLREGRWAYGWTCPTLGDLAEAIKVSRNH